MTRPVYPNLVVGRSDIPEDAPWVVVPGSSARGAASCDFGMRQITVPLGDTPVDRVVRAHELVHLRLSPSRIDQDELVNDVSERALTCAEELRVNTVLGRLGFETELLRDGSERVTGERLSESGDWAEAVLFYAALHGTGSAKEFLLGIRKHRPEWARAIRSFGRTLTSTLGEISTVKMTSTQLLDGASIPAGYLTTTVRIARLVDRVAGARAPVTSDEFKAFRRSMQPGGRRPPSGRFATLVLDSSLEYVSVRPRVGGTRSRYDVSGVGGPKVHRLLTDEQRRIFAKRVMGAGAVVLIDQSGSMDIPEADLEALINAVPGVTVIGYSHRPGDIAGLPNAWVLADRGRRARSWPAGNVGNGVDGPALRYALETRRPNDRVVWVTDGQVTDSNDHPNEALSAECAQLVRRHRILLVRAVSEVPGALRRSGIQQLQCREFGRIGQKLGDLS